MMLRRLLTAGALVVGFASAPAMAEIDLVVDVITGEVKVVSNEASGDLLAAYQITDPSVATPSLIEDNWVPLSSQGYTGWFPLPSSDIELAEGTLDDEDSALVDTTGISLGNAFQPTGEQDLVFFYVLQGDPGEIQGNVVYIVPEPTTALAGLSAAGLMLMRRRR